MSYNVLDELETIAGNAKKARDLAKRADAEVMSKEELIEFLKSLVKSGDLGPRPVHNYINDMASEFSGSESESSSSSKRDRSEYEEEEEVDPLVIIALYKARKVLQTLGDATRVAHIDDKLRKYADDTCEPTFTVSERIRVLFPTRELPKMNVLMDIGKRASALFNQYYGCRPDTTRRNIDGEMKNVNVYTEDQSKNALDKAIIEFM
jgi:hypothetical protein